jgi:hypothetical protein
MGFEDEGELFGTGEDISLLFRRGVLGLCGLRAMMLKS